jgi:hypothetical protein
MMDFEELMNKTPSALEDYIALPQLGGVITVYEGEFTIHARDKFVCLNGRIFYSFAERIELLIEGEADSLLYDWYGIRAKIIVGESYRGTAFLEVVSGRTVKGAVFSFETNASIPFVRWRWCYLNGPCIFGDDVRRVRCVSRDRLVFLDGGYEIVFENKAQYKQQKRHREISHFCEMRHQDGSPFPLEEALKEITLFSNFVSFFAGCRHAPFFIEGLSSEGDKYEYHTVGLDSSLIGVSSWKPDFKDHDLIPLWTSFQSKAKESLDQSDVLNTAIHWYLQANMNNGRLEGAFILGFTGLELLSNEMVGKELGNQEIIEDFILRLHINHKIKPQEISQMRNYLVHYKDKNRRTSYNSLTFEEKVFRLEVVLQILELAILYWLGYQGHYSDRLFQTWRGDGTILVPWSLN